MASYRVTFYKNLLSSDGHQFKCPQRTIEIRTARNLDRAVMAAQLRYQRLRHARNWVDYADVFDIEALPSDLLPAKRSTHDIWPRR